MSNNEEEKSKYPVLKEYLNSELEFFPDEEELQRIVNESIRAETHNQNVGFKLDRLEHNAREKAFHDQWLHDNRPVRGVNYGHGTLQDLFICPKKGSNLLGGETYCHTVVNERDRMIVATVIQWLGTNCGMGFLYEALRKCGLCIINIKKD